MHRVDTSSAVAVQPAPEAAGPPGFFTKGNPLGGPLATVPGQDWFNMMQEEGNHVVEFAGLTPDQTKVDFTQLRQAIQRIAAASTDIAFQAGWGADGTGEDLAVQTYGALTAPRAFSIAGVLANIQAGPVGADLILDIEVEGVSIFSTKPEIADGATVLTAGVMTSTPDPFPVSAGDEIVFKITQIGSTTAGQRLTVTLVGGLPA